MSALRSIVLGCVSDGGQQQQQQQPRTMSMTTNSNCKHPKVKFGVPLAEAFKGDTVPDQLVDILAYIGREGIGTMDLFRRPGSQPDIKVIMKKLSEGQEVNLPDYNFYTLASVIKKFLLRIPGGIFGTDVEMQLLQMLEIDDRLKQLKAIQSIIASLAPAVQQLSALLFGTWFWVVNYSDCKSRSSESVSKSIAGSLFHTCSDDPAKIEQAAQVLQILINNFGDAEMFGRQNVEYFVKVMRSSVAEDLIKSRTSALSCLTKDDSIQRSITETEFCRHLQPMAPNTRAALGGSSVEIQLPQSCQGSDESLAAEIQYRNNDKKYRQHRKLTRVSSISAPDVNQECLCPRSSRYDSVRRRQMRRMKERSCWFLSPSAKNSTDPGSHSFNTTTSSSLGSPASRHRISSETSTACCNSSRTEVATNGSHGAEADELQSSAHELVPQKLSDRYGEWDDSEMILQELKLEPRPFLDRKAAQTHQQEVKKDWGRWKRGIIH